MLLQDELFGIIRREMDDLEDIQYREDEETLLVAPDLW